MTLQKSAIVTSVFVFVFLAATQLEVLNDGISDAAPDWIFSKAAWAGFDPYIGWVELGDKLDVDAVDFGRPSKTPAVAVVAWPWHLVPYDLVEPVALTVNLAALVAILILSSRITRQPLKWWWVVAAAAAYPVRTSLEWGNPIFVWVALILFTWWAARRSDDWWAGVPLGVAAAVRLWPMLIAVPLWFGGRRKMAVAAGGVAVGLNLAGLALPAVTFDRASRALLDAGQFWIDWGTNSSLGRLFGGDAAITVVFVGIGIVFVWWLSRRTGMEATGAAALTAVVVSPLAWMSYYLVALPVIVRRWPISAVPALLIGFSGWWGLVLAGGVVLLVLESKQLCEQSETTPLEVSSPSRRTRVAPTGG